MPPYPLSYEEDQPDGTTIYLQLRGDLEFNYETDSDGYPVVELEDGFSVYASYNSTSSKLDASHSRVGRTDPRELELNKVPLKLPRNPSITSFADHWTRDHHHKRDWTSSWILDTSASSASSDTSRTSKSQKSDGRRMRGGSSRHLMRLDSMKNLVVLICFADHDMNKLPSPEDYQTLFNAEGPNKLASTGSVRDVYTTSSYDKITIESVIYPWIKLPETESYYADDEAGGSSKIHEALIQALEIIDNDEDFDWDDFDRDDNRRIDSITFVHSGYGAEFGGRDCRRIKWPQRIWSHMWQMDKAWRSKGKKGIKIKEYQIASGLWGRNPAKCEYEMMHIGVISHEIAHFLGLDDQYGGSDGLGIGSYGLMGNAWGADFSQNYPPIMSPFNKMKLGWIKPIELKKSGVYDIKASYNESMVYKIKDGFDKDEYLLIENRQPQLFDSTMPQGGLLIWHIDERATLDTDGSPGQDGWPENGNHYINALLQADGKYDLENGMNYGDGSDVFHGDGVDSIGPAGTSIGPYPNTNMYQKGKIKETGHIIDQISKSGDVMTFRFTNGRDRKEIEPNGKEKGKTKMPK